MNSIFFTRTMALVVILSPILEAQNPRVKINEVFHAPSVSWGATTQDPTSSNPGGPAHVKQAYTVQNGTYRHSYYQGDQMPGTTTVPATSTPASELSERVSSTGDPDKADGAQNRTSVTFSVTLTYTDPRENGGGLSATSTETKNVDIEFVGRGGGGPRRTDGSPIDGGGGGGGIVIGGGGGGKGGDGGGYHDCAVPFTPGTLTPNPIIDDRTPLVLPLPASLELVSENIAAYGHKYGYDTYIATTPPKRFSTKNVSTHLADNTGNAESPVGGTFTETINRPDGQRIRTAQTGNPSYYGTSDGGTRTETTYSIAQSVTHYDDCPNLLSDDPAVMEIQENITGEYTTDELKVAVFDKAFEFKGDGYYLHETALAKLDVSTDELNVDYQKTKYKWRIPADTAAYPRPYRVTWVEVFTPEDTNPEDEVEPTKEYKAFSEEIPAGKSETAEHSIDPASFTPQKEGTWEVSQFPVEVGVDNNRDGNLDLSAVGDKTTAGKAYRFWLNNDHDLYSNDTYNADDDHPWTTQSLDNADTLIDLERDLEDLARLHLKVEGIQSQLEAGTMTLGLKWKSTLSGTPKIRLFKAVEVDGGTKYLSDAAQAASQIADGRSGLGVVQGSGVFDLPVSFWTSTSASSTKHLLFEGVGEGKGELTLVIKKNGAVVQESGSVFLDLLDIRKMYERWKVDDSAVIEDPDKDTVAVVTGVSQVKDDFGFPFEAAWDEDLTDKQYVICVHGWRKKYTKATSDEITMFKRLWHRGFKGRYIGFKWPTYDVMVDDGSGPYDEYQSAVQSKYNHSEFRAWKCGEALKAMVAGLPASYSKKIFAHSLGNVVVGSALEKGMNVSHYGLLNASIPASCYDKGAVARASVDPDFADDINAVIRALSYRGDTVTSGKARLESVSPGGVITNFYLPSDSSLTGNLGWEGNQDNFLGKGKPVGGYDYEPASQVEWDPSVFNPPLRVVSDPHEAMSMVNKCKTKAAGAVSVGGRINANGDMNGVGMLFDVEHEAAFKWRCCKTWVFYGKLWDALDLAGTAAP